MHSISLFFIVSPLSLESIAIGISILPSPILESLHHMSYIIISVLEQIGAFTFHLICNPMSTIDIPFPKVTNPNPLFKPAFQVTHID